jgi:hypothetical protein
MAGWGIRTRKVTLNPTPESGLRVIQQLILEDLAEIAYVSLRTQIETGDTAFPLSEMTKWLREKEGKGLRARVSTGDFLRALEKNVEEGKATVGILVPRGAKGQDMEMLARVMEGGATVPVTQRMRKWFAAQGKPLKRTTVALKIPPRPIFDPVLGELEDKIDEVVNRYMDQILEGI